MQLDLFFDNRRTIYLNEADKMLRSLDLAKAEAIYTDLLTDYPGEGEILALREEAAMWQQRGSLSGVGCTESFPSL